MLRTRNPLALPFVLYAILGTLASQAKEPGLLIDFGNSVQTAEGGYFHVFGGKPNEIADSLVSVGSPSTEAWRIDVSDRADEVGCLIPLRNNHSSSRRTTSRRLKLICTGQLNERSLVIEATASPGPDSRGVAIGEISPKELSENRWKEFSFKLPRSSSSQPPPAYLRIKATGSGKCWLAIDKVQFGTTSSNSDESPDNLRVTHPTKIAMWVWNTPEILAQPDGISTLLNFCGKEGVTDLYVQIPYEYDNGRIHFKNPGQLLALNEAASEAEVAIHALDGAPKYVLPEHHPRMKSLVVAISKFNRRASPNQRFHSVHLDNEPYVLPDWKNDTIRPEIIRNYIDLNRSLSQIAAEHHLEFGVDIPFWFDVEDDQGQTRFLYESEGKSIPLLEALFPLLDHVGVMSYRERVLGPNGFVALCENEFKLGVEHGVEVFVSVELGVGKDVEPGTSLGRFNADYIRTQLRTLQRVLPHIEGCGGMAIHYYRPYAAMR